MFPLPLGAADFGDAPDGSDTAYPVSSGQPAVMGNFPTLFASNGALHINLGEEWLGKANSAPDSEADANVVNNDLFENAFPPIPFFLVLTSLPPMASVSFWVTVDGSAPTLDRYVNMLIDWDQSGDWKNIAGAAPEWAIMNHVVNIPPGTTRLITVPIQWGLGAQLAPQIFWVRVTLSRTMIDPAPFGANGWDGTGTFQYGETEDFLFHPNKRHDDPGTPWSPPANPPAGWTPPLPGNMPGIQLLPKSQNVAHGTPATVTVQLVNGDAPATLEWAVDPGQRGGFLFAGGSPKMPFGGSWGPEPSGSTATATPTGSTPVLGLITINSTVHPLFPNVEEWPLRVKARWPGIRTQTRKAVVRIWHTGWGGIFAIWANFDILWWDIWYTVLQPDLDDLLQLWQRAFDHWQWGDYPTAQDYLGQLDDAIADLELAGLISPPDADRLRHLSKDISQAIFNLPAVAPVPDLVQPQDGDTLRGLIDLIAETVSPNVTGADFQVTFDGDVWHKLGWDSNGADGWSVPWDTAAWPDGTARLKVIMENSLGELGEHESFVWIDNTPPMPVVMTPVDTQSVCGILPIEISCDPDDDVSCVFEITANGTDWAEIGRDDDASDGLTTLLDTGRMEAAKYQLRATVTDEAGNSAQTPQWRITVEPSFVAWKHAYGMMDLGPDDDPNADGVQLGTEYYLGMSPNHHNALAGEVFWEQISGPDFRIRYRPNEHVDGVRCAIQATEDLGLWGDLSTDPVPEPSGEVVVPVPTLPKRFVRLNVWEDRP